MNKCRGIIKQSDHTKLFWCRDIEKVVKIISLFIHSTQPDFMENEQLFLKHVNNEVHVLSYIFNKLIIYLK